MSAPHSDKEAFDRLSEAEKIKVLMPHNDIHWRHEAFLNQAREGETLKRLPVLIDLTDVTKLEATASERSALTIAVLGIWSGSREVVMESRPERLSIALNGAVGPVATGG